MQRFRFASVAIVAAMLAVGGPAVANVGVTSATSGDPVGQPPAQQERVLRVGVDMQANERVTTKADDRAHLVFLDGTALTVGPNSTIVIDKFVFDPNSQKGEIVLGASKGLFRLVGGAISKGGEIKVTTPSSTIGIRGGIATIAVAENGATTATFLYGKSLTVTSQGKTETATRNGSQIHVDTGRAPLAATIVPPRAVVAGAVIEKPAAVIAVAPLARVATLATPVVAPVARPAVVAPVVATPVVVTPAVPITVAVDQALATSKLSEKNSKIRISKLIDDDGPQKGDGRGQGPQRQAGKPQGAGPAPAAAVPKITAVLRLTTVANRAVVQQQATRAQVNGPPGQTKKNEVRSADRR